MCTASWLYSDFGYQVFFNRDEQRKRVLANPPEVFRSGNNLRAIMPFDPQGGGTWIAVNEAGLTFALLNYYQGQIPAGDLHSRGAIVRSLAGCSDKESAINLVLDLNLKKYAPFSLLVFSREQSNPIQVRWDGEYLLQDTVESPLISSGYDFPGVYKSRSAQFEVIEKKGVTTGQLLSIHKSHNPEACAYSVCMHRPDAHTVSFSHIVVEDKIRFDYSPGAPCRVAPSDYVSCELLLEEALL